MWPIFCMYICLVNCKLLHVKLLQSSDSLVYIGNSLLYLQASRAIFLIQMRLCDQEDLSLQQHHYGTSSLACMIKLKSLITHIRSCYIYVLNDGEAETASILGPLNLWQRRHCVPLKQWETLMQQNSVTAQKTWFLNKYSIFIIGWMCELHEGLKKYRFENCWYIKNNFRTIGSPENNYWAMPWLRQLVASL